MTTVTVSKELEVDIYEVKDEFGNDLNFTVEVDSDGDLRITVDTMDVLAVREYLDDEDNLQELVDQSCIGGRMLALELLITSFNEQILTDETRSKIKDILKQF